MVSTNMQRILRDARKLPRQTQTQLAVILLGAPSTRKEAQKRNHKKNGAGLETLSGMSIDELRALANARIAPAPQRRLTALLRKSKTIKMSEKDETALNTIIDECDHLALLKAKAMYTLSVLNLS